MILLMDGSKKPIIKTERRAVVTRTWDGRNVEMLVKGYKLSYKMNKFWEFNIQHGNS